MTVLSYFRNCAAVSRGDTKRGNFWFLSKKSLTHRRRVSSGLNWNPHFIVCAGFVVVSTDDVESFRVVVASLYPISVGTLSDVIPNVHELHEVCCCLTAMLRTIASWPCLDDVNVLGAGRVYCCHAYITSVFDPDKIVQLSNPPL